MTRCLRWISALALALLAGGTLAAQDQPLGLKKCSDPKVPIGLVHGSGELRFDISAKGKPDTSTIEVLSVTGISPAGLRSAVGRQLSACEFNTKDAHLTGVTRVRQGWSFEGPRTRFGGAIKSDTGTAMALTPMTPPADPVPDSSAVLEEHPRWLSCRSNAQPGTPDAGGSADVSAGTSVWVQFVVDSTGKVVPSTVHAVESNDLVASNTAVQDYTGCRYVPGRIGGAPVQTVMLVRDLVQSGSSAPASSGRGRRR